MANDIWKPEEYMAYHKMVFRVMFDFLNTHFPPHEGPEWWKQLSLDISDASNQAKGGPLVDGFLTAIGDYLEEEYERSRHDV